MTYKEEMEKFIKELDDMKKIHDAYNKHIMVEKAICKCGKFDRFYISNSTKSEKAIISFIDYHCQKYSLKTIYGYIMTYITKDIEFVYKKILELGFTKDEILDMFQNIYLGYTEVDLCLAYFKDYCFDLIPKIKNKMDLIKAMMNNIDKFSPGMQSMLIKKYKVNHVNSLLAIDEELIKQAKIAKDFFNNIEINEETLKQINKIRKIIEIHKPLNFLIRNPQIIEKMLKEKLYDIVFFFSVTYFLEHVITMGLLNPNENALALMPEYMRKYYKYIGYGELKKDYNKHGYIVYKDKVYAIYIEKK